MTPSTAVTVEVEGFSGPFDLLLGLIERGKLDVLAISLAAVADQYLDRLTRLQLRDPEHLSAFLVVAAKLLLIKSTLLLPTRPRNADAASEAEDPTDLTERLREYQRYRAAAGTLDRRLDAALRSYPHAPPVYRPGKPLAPERLDPGLLPEAYRRAARRGSQAPAPAPLAVAPYSVADALAAIRDGFARESTLRFADLLTPAADRSRAIATFLAILELVRLGGATVAQEERFGEIVVKKTD